jgi:hypothetical protein
VVERGTGTSREVGVGKSAAVMEAEAGTAAVEIGTITSRELEVRMEAAESAAAVEAEGDVIREGDQGVIDADGEAFTTGIVESAESTSAIGPTTSERIALNGAGCFSVEVPSLLPSKGLRCLVEKSANYIVMSTQQSPFLSFSWVHWLQTVQRQVVLTEQVRRHQLRQLLLLLLSS